MARLTQDEAEVVALWRLEADGYNGGFLQFFCNWGEQNCSIALTSLRRIGAANTLLVVQEQRDIVERLNGHPGVKTYGDIYSFLSTDDLDRISEQLDPAFWKAAEEIPNLALPAYRHVLNDYA